MAGEQAVGRGGEVGRLQGAAQVVYGVQQHIELRLALDRREEALLLPGKGRQTDRVALAQGHIAEQQAGIEGVVEVRQFAVLAAHAPAAVEQEDDLLVALVLVLAGDRRALAGGGLPVDLAQAVAVAEFAQLVKLQAQTAAWPLAHAELAEPVVDRHQLRAIQAGEVRVDPGFPGQGQVAARAPQA
ncbi:hypothetical protein D3C85_1017040 [compost metagenome]